MKIRSHAWRAFALATSLLATGCGLLDVSDPTAVEEADVANPDGPNLLRSEAITQLHDAVGYAALHGGLVADEFFAIPSAFLIQTGNLPVEHWVDRRELRGTEAERIGKPVHDRWQAARLSATHALNWYRRYGVAAQRPYMGQMFAIRGHAVVGLAEQVCSGFALHELDWDRPRFMPPITTAQAYEHALVEIDSAMAAVGDSTRFLHFAQVTRARALLGLGRFEEAAAAAATVPTSYVMNGEYSGTNPGKPNRLRVSTASGTTKSVANGEGTNGLDFVSANDPRLPMARVGVAHDGRTVVYGATRYQGTTATIAIASGIEARLIEAEAALHAGDDRWLTILNDLRATQVTPAMAPLADPLTPEARVDLLFRERAFWLFGTGHRLGDMRRLVRQYGRDPETVYPVGDHPITGRYLQGTSLPFDITGEEWAGTGVTGCVD